MDDTTSTPKPTLQDGVIALGDACGHLRNRMAGGATDVESVDLAAAVAQAEAALAAIKAALAG